MREAATARLFRPSDRAWAALDPRLPRGRPGEPRVDDRRAIGGILLHVPETGRRRRGVPRGRGPATTAHDRCNRWPRRGVWARPLEKAAATGDVPGELAPDSTRVEAHRPAAGGEGGMNGRGRSGARAAAAPRRPASRPVIAADRSPSR